MLASSWRLIVAVLYVFQPIHNLENTQNAILLRYLTLCENQKLLDQKNFLLKMCNELCGILEQKKTASISPGVYQLQSVSVWIKMVLKKISLKRQIFENPLVVHSSSRVLSNFGWHRKSITTKIAMVFWLFQPSPCPNQTHTSYQHVEQSPPKTDATMFNNSFLDNVSRCEPALPVIKPFSHHLLQFILNLIFSMMLKWLILTDSGAINR